MSHATETTISRLGDVTNARDKQTVLCPLLIEPALAVSLNALDFAVCLACVAGVERGRG